MNWLRKLADETSAEDEQMAEHGYQVERTGPFSRSYRLSPQRRAQLEAEAEREHVAQMAANVKAMFAVAFPEAAAELARHEASQASATGRTNADTQP